MSTELLRAWEQRENESQEAFEAFDIYKDMGSDRSLAKVAAQLGKSTQLMERWSQRDNWRVRCLAWDRHKSRITNEKILLGTAEMRARLASQAMNMQHRAAARVLSMTDNDIKRLSTGQIVALFKAGADVEMKVRAIPEDELDAAERDDAPTFNINFIKGLPEGMVSVRMATGEVGYVPAERVDDFLGKYPDAMAIR